MFLRMSRKELERVQVMQELNRKRVTQCRAAELLGVSERQVRRMDGEIRAPAVAIMKEVDFRDYGPTLFSEALEEEKGMRLSHESMRQLMIAEGRWRSQRSLQP